MKKITHIVYTVALFAAFPAVAFGQSIQYGKDGAVLLGESQATTNNLMAAIGGSNLSLACLAAVILMLISVYIFHEIWHPKRLHEEMTKDEIKRGTIKFYIGGTFVWILVAIMAESWCLLLPLTAILAAVLIYYVVTISSITDTKQPPTEN